MAHVPFRTLQSKTIYENPWLRLKQDEVEKESDGHRFTYTYISVAPSVMVVAVTAENEILLVRQYRYPTRRFSYELPGGGSGGAEPAEAAARELAEETGYRAGSIDKLGEFVTYCGLADEICHVYLARELQPGGQKLDQTEHLSVESVSYPRLRGMIASGEFMDGMGLAALHLARERLDAELGV